MEKINKESLQVSFYEHFKSHFEKRGVAIVTNRQYALYTQLDKNDGLTHNTALKALDLMMYPEKDYEGIRYGVTLDIAMHSYYNELFFYFPYDGVISPNQYTMMKSILEEIKLVNEDLPDHMKYIVYFHGRKPELIRHSKEMDDLIALLDKFTLEEREEQLKQELIGVSIESINSRKGR